MNSTPGRILALDLGSRRIGLAISDGLGLTAQGLDTLERRNKRTDLAILGKLIRERGITEILMGNPLNMRGDAGRQSGWVEEFAVALRKHTGLPVRLWDERLTTLAAYRALREGGQKTRDSRGFVDQVAAQMILQGYLDGLQTARDRNPAAEIRPND